MVEEEINHTSSNQFLNLDGCEEIAELEAIYKQLYRHQRSSSFDTESPTFGDVMTVPKLQQTAQKVTSISNYI
jgi:hypothetical protein